MDWNDSPAQAEFRAGVRQLIAEKLPARYRGDDGAEGEGDGVEWMVERRSQDPVAQQASAEWATAISERGWIAPHWPVEYGGAGLSPIEQMIYNQEMAMAAAPRRVGGQGVSQFGPALVVHGPLQATLLADLAARNLPAPLTGFDYRGQSPAFDGVTLHLCGDPGNNGAAVWSQQGTVKSMVATATC